MQAVHRARLVRENGRNVVILFSRPIPGLPPTQTITDRVTSPATTKRRQETLDRLLTAAKDLIDNRGAFSRPMLTEASGVHYRTVDKYWEQMTSSLSLNWFDMPVIQTLATGGKRKTQIRIALPATVVADARLYVTRGRYQNLFIAIARHIQPCIPDGWEVDLPPTPGPVEEGGAPLLVVESTVDHAEMLKIVAQARRAGVPISVISLAGGEWFIQRE